MTKQSLLHVFVLIVFILSSSLSAMGKNPVLKNTKWTAVEEMFVADAGTMTITHTLEFISNKEVRIHEKSVLPPYPAMYMNPDGTIDTMPGHTSERSETGTYRFRRGILTITTENGLELTYTILPTGSIAGKTPWGETVIFNPSED